jgi:hypothetical protein
MSESMLWNCNSLISALGFFITNLAKLSGFVFLILIKGFPLDELFTINVL